MGSVPYNFQEFARDQIFLLPPSIEEWVPEGDLANMVIAAVEEMDLSAFYVDYREDGWGGAAHHPKMMVSLLLYAYCLGMRSSRQIERACHFDIRFRVICATQTPDHTTIARFRQRHEKALQSLFGASLRLCHRAGMVKVGVVALDGTKVAGQASVRANQSKATIDAEVERMLEEAASADAAEDERFGEGSGEEETPAHLRGRKDRRRRFAEAKKQLDAELEAEQKAYQARLAERAAKERETGKPVTGRKPKAPQERTGYKEPKVNTSDPESRLMVGLNGGILQGYNAQAVATEEQVIVAAVVTNEEADTHQLLPMIKAVTQSLAEAGINARPECLLADAGYASEANFKDLPKDLDAYVATRNMKRNPTPRGGPGPLPEDASLFHRMDRKVASEAGRDLYAKRQKIIEPVFGQIKEARGARRFQRLGLAAAQAEWQLIAATHNLLKLFRKAQRNPTAVPYWRAAETT